MVRRGEVWYANLPMIEGSNIQGGNRPVVILTNDICNEVNSIVTVVPLTRQMKKMYLPTHVVMPGGESIALIEQITTIDKKCLDNRIGSISAEQMRIIEEAIKEQLGMKGETYE